MASRILIGDCRERMRELPDNSVDSVVCDPPYHLTSIVKRFGSENAAPAKSNGATGVYGRASKGFMGQTWDGGDVAFDPDTWAEVLRVLKPGGHLVAFSGTRTYHRMVCAIEDAGFEIRDQLAWVYGSGFPKSLDVSKQIDKAAGAEREVIGPSPFAARKPNGSAGVNSIGLTATPGHDLTAPATEAAREWQGWGTALKPSWEPICLARKPLGSPAIFVRKRIEDELRARGVVGTITWKPEPVSGAASSSSTISSSPTHQPKAAETSARNVGVSEPPNSALPTLSASSKRTRNGETEAEPTSSATNVTVIGGSGGKCLPDMAGDASAVEKQKIVSSQSTTSTEAEQPTGKPSTARCTISCSERDSQLDSEYFAGIATGLTGSLALAHIRRDHSGSFVWPDGLPEHVPGCPQTVAANVLAHGTGALNIDATRIGMSEEDADFIRKTARPNSAGQAHDGTVNNRPEAPTVNVHPQGRWPANLCHDGSEEVLAGFPDLHGAGYAQGKQTKWADQEQKEGWGNIGLGPNGARFGDSGSAARFFYTAKATTAERGEGNSHPTVKPIALMRWLVRLVTPKGGTVLDPFMGSGSTLLAAEAEQFNAIGCEMSPEYAAIAERRLKDAGGMFSDVVIDREAA